MKFWDEMFTNMPIETIKDDLLGCEVLEKVFRQLATGAKTVLDYGCGSGWATFSLAYNGANVIAVDQSYNAIQYVNATSLANKLSNVKTLIGDETILNLVSDNYFDSAFSCNVLDVIPQDKAEEILSQLKRVVKNGGKIIITLNPYLTKEFAEEIKMNEFAPNLYEKDGIMRAHNLSKDEWIELFSKFFTFEDFFLFQFESERKELFRRMFVLVNNKSV